MKPKFGIVVFPGSNCDHDAYHVLKHQLQQDTVFLWHKSSSLEQADVVVLPGGFSYGDYLRCGAIARVSPIMREVTAFAQKGGIVIGICNGFQILCEAGLLPGALLRNEQLTFSCKFVNIRVETAGTMFTRQCEQGETLSIPIAHGEGNYYVNSDTLREMEEQEQILFRYCTAEGSISKSANPNGSLANIAGVVNKNKNVMGMMPHPERAADPVIGPTDGQKIFHSVLSHLSERFAHQ